jgi:sec-independent protein translocase protein TatB
MQLAMFDFSWAELLLIGMVALVMIGPKELPAVLRTLGQWTAKLRRMAAELQNQFQEVMREAEIADLKKRADEMTSQVRSYANFDLPRELRSTQRQIESAVTDALKIEVSSVAAEQTNSQMITSPAAQPSSLASGDGGTAAAAPAPNHTAAHS